ncbi:MAG: hypothetical protein ACRCX2_15305, partial [Paraclostridium sp.]
TKVYKSWSFIDREFVQTDLGNFEYIHGDFFKLDTNFKTIKPCIKMNCKEKKDVLVWLSN